MEISVDTDPSVQVNMEKTSHEVTTVETIQEVTSVETVLNEVKTDFNSTHCVSINEKIEDRNIQLQNEDSNNLHKANFNSFPPESQASKRLGKTVTKLIAEGYEDPAKYPPLIKETSDKEITLRIELNDDNILLNSTLYYATDAYDCSVSTSTKSGPTVTGTKLSDFGDTDVVEVSNSRYTPECANSSTKKIKVEKCS
ncbi:hypothetical protein AgCh_031529 [Apium graveolens]